jgi:hypothetical protein
MTGKIKIVDLEYFVEYQAEQAGHENSWYNIIPISKRYITEHMINGDLIEFDTYTDTVISGGLRPLDDCGGKGLKYHSTTYAIHVKKL